MTKHTKQPVTAFPTPSRPFQIYEIDLYGPLPTSRKGNNYIFKATCMFSKYLYACPIKSKDATTLSDTIFDLVLTYGSPDCIITDLGSEMTADITEKVC